MMPPELFGGIVAIALAGWLAFAGVSLLILGLDTIEQWGWV